MKTKLRKFGAGLLALALAFAGAGAYGATQVANQTELNDAVKAAAAGEVVEITAAGTYTMPALPANITIKGVDGVVFNCEGSGSICSVPNGATLENITFKMGQSGYHGWHHAGPMTFNNCAFEGLWLNYGTIFCNDCSFIQTKGEYHMWIYGGNATFTRCQFTGQGKFFNVYNEGNTPVDAPWVVLYDTCNFSSTVKNKSGVNVKATCGSTKLSLRVTLKDCTTDTPDFFPTDKRLHQPLVMIDDGDSDYVTIIYNDFTLYEKSTEFELPPEDTPVKVDTKDVEVKDASGKVITDEKAVAAVKEITDAVAAIGLTEKEDTKVEKAVVSGTDDEQIVKAEVIEALKSEAGTPEVKSAVEAVAATEVKSYLNIKLESVGVSADKVAKVVYDVKPHVKVTVVVGDAQKSTIDTVIPNEAIEEKIAFTLPVASFQGTSALVSHFENGELIESFFKEITEEGSQKVVALESDRFSTWELVDAVKVADGFYKNQAETEFYIMDLDGLNNFRDSVNDGNTYAGKTVYLANDVDFAGASWEKGIGGTFKGTFDGQGAAIKNLKISAVGNNVGLFTAPEGVDVHLPAIIRNLTLVAPQIETVPPSEGADAQYVGAFCGGAKWVTIENCAVSGGKISCVDQVGGVVGFGLTVTVKGCTLDGVTVEAKGDRAGGIISKAQYGCSISGNTIKNCTITSAGLNATYCGASAIVAQMWANNVEGGGLCSICDNTIVDTTTSSGGDEALVPIGNSRDGLESEKCEFLRNHWEPETSTVDSRAVKCKVGEETKRIEIANFNPVAQIEGKGLAARYESLQAAIDAAVAGETVQLLCDIEQTDDLILLGKNMAIDFAEKTLSVKTGIRVLSDVTFRNGTLDLSGATGSGHGGNTAHPGGNLTSVWTMNAHLTLDGMTFSAVDVQATYMVEMSTPSTIDFKNSIVSLDGINIGFLLNPNCGIRIEDSQVSVKHMRGGSGSGFIYGSDYSACSLALVNSSVTVSDSVAGAKAKGITLCGPMTVAKSTIVGKDLNNCLIQYCTPVLTDGSSITMDNTDGIEQSSLTVNAGCSVVGVGTGSRDHFGYTQLPGSVLKAGAIVNVDEITFYYNTADLTVEAGADVTVRTKLDVSSAIPHAGSVKIAGGKYNNLVQAGSTKRLDITGGLYKVKPADGYVNPCYEAVENEDESTKAEGYQWKVVPKPSVAEILDAEGASLGEIYSFELALEQVPTNGTIKILVDDASFAITDTGKSFKIVPNTHTLGEISVPTGYELKNNAGVLTFRKTPIATITRESVTTEYATLPAACAEAQSGDVIQLAALEIDATDAYVIKDLTGKTVTVKGAGQDKTTLLWGTGLKYGTGSNSYLTGANITFEDLAVTIAHDSGMPYVQWMDHPASQTFRNVKINGLIVTMDPAVFDGCTFAGPQQNSAKGAPDEYLIWNYGNHVYVTNCTFAASGTHAPIKLYNDSGVKCSATVVDTTFAAVGDENGAITTASSSDNFAYDIQVDVDSVTVPAGATLIGYDPNYGSKKVNMVNGTTDANGKYTSGAIFSDRGTDEQILTIVAKIVAEGYTALPYTGAATVLGNYRWYVGPQQLQPKTDEAEADAKSEVKQAVAEQMDKTVEEVQTDINAAVTDVKTEVAEAATSRAVTQFAESGLDEAVVKTDGSLDPRVIAALKEGKTPAEQEKIAQLSSDSNSTKRIQIELKKIDVGLAVSGEAVVGSANEVTYDVVPRVKTVIEVKNDQGEVTSTIQSEAKVPNETIANSPITFRLGVTWNEGEKVKVLRDEQNFGITTVKAGTDGNYVELTSNHFSEFKLLRVNVPTVCKVGDLEFETIDAAIAASDDAYDTTIEMLADVDGEVTVTGLGKRVIDTNGKSFEAVITPDGDLEVVKGSGGKRYLAAPKVEVKTGESTVMPIRGYVFPSDVTAPDAKADYLAGDSETGNKLWQDYVLFGNEGTRVKLTPEIVKAAEGSSVVTIKAKGDYVLSSPTRCGVKVSFQLLKRDGTTGNFAEVGEASATPSFTVDVKEIGPKTYWKIQTIFSCEEERL